MSLVIQTVIIGILALLSNFIFSPMVAGWVIWLGYLFFTVTLFLKGLQDRRELLNSNTGDLTGAIVLPPAMCLVAVALVTFIYFNFNKFHLLWVAPLLTFIAELLVKKISFSKLESNIIDNHKR